MRVRFIIIIGCGRMMIANLLAAANQLLRQSQLLSGVVCKAMVCLLACTTITGAHTFARNLQCSIINLQSAIRIRSERN